MEVIILDLKQVEYVVKIAEAGGITKAAEQLFITQSALNQQLLKLENELGIQLFHRRKNNFTPTDAGDVYIRYGRQMLQEKREAYNIIDDLAKNNAGHLSLAFSPERGIEMFVATYPIFHKQFPGIIVEPQEMRVASQLSQINKGYIDLGLVTVEEKEKSLDLEYEHIRYEPLLLALPRCNPLAQNATDPDALLEDLPYMDLKKCERNPFVLMSKGSTLSAIIYKIFKQANFSPNVIFETASNRTLITMAKNNIACTITSAEYYQYREDIAYYRIPGDPRWEVCTIYKKGAYRSKAMICFDNLIHDFFIKQSPLKTKNPTVF
jgi:DNA-binding transcriptional LysR family regulator